MRRALSIGIVFATATAVAAEAESVGISRANQLRAARGVAATSLYSERSRGSLTISLVPKLSFGRSILLKLRFLSEPLPLTCLPCANSVFGVRSSAFSVRCCLCPLQHADASTL